MKFRKTASIIILSLLIVSSVVLSSCSSCVSDKTTTGTKYNIMMIGDITAKEGSTHLSDITWSAVKKYTEGTDMKYKSFAPSEVEAMNRVETDQVQQSVAKRLSYNTQIELAASQKAPDKAIIVLPGEEYVDAYLENVLKDSSYDKKYSGVWFLLTGVSSVHQSADVANIGTRAITLVINENEYGQLYGYTAVKLGYKNIGYLGSDSEYSTSFKAGIQEGINKAKTELSITDVTFTDNIDYSSENSARVASLYGSCDIVIPENESFSEILKNNASGKAYATMGVDDSSVFGYDFNTDKLREVIQNNITALSNKGENKDVKFTGCADGIWNYNGKDNSDFTVDDAKAFMKTFED